MVYLGPSNKEKCIIKQQLGLDDSQMQKGMLDSIILSSYSVLYVHVSSPLITTTLRGGCRYPSLFKWGSAFHIQQNKLK